MEKINKTDAEWRMELSDLEYKVTRKHGTERPFSNDNFPKSEGIFKCKCCGNSLFNSCLLYTSPSPRDVEESRMPSSA